MERLPHENYSQISIQFQLPGQHGAHCVGPTDHALQSLPYVVTLKVKMATETTTVDFDTSVNWPTQIADVVTNAGGPAAIAVDDTLIGPTTNGTEAVRFRAARVGQDTMLARVIAMAKQARTVDPPIWITCPSAAELAVIEMSDPIKPN